MNLHIEDNPDVIDSRDLVEDIETIESKIVEIRANLEEQMQVNDLEIREMLEKKLAMDNFALLEEEFDSYTAKIYKELLEAKEEIPEFEDGNTLIRTGKAWVDYVKDLLEDVGDLPKNLPHYIEIDWEKTADNIAVDYSEITLDGNIYLYRNC
jgi:hypothetical protein